MTTFDLSRGSCWNVLMHTVEDLLALSQASIVGKLYVILEELDVLPVLEVIPSVFFFFSELFLLFRLFLQGLFSLASSNDDKRVLVAILHLFIVSIIT